MTASNEYRAGLSARLKSLPRYDDSPAAPQKIVSASPETIWFARSVITRNARISAADAAREGGDDDRDRKHDPGRAADPLHGAEPHHGADEHHPLDAEVEHARALGEQLAERRVEQRRAVRDGGREHDDDDAVVHACRPRRDAARGGPSATNVIRYGTSSSPPSIANRIMPCITPTSPDGKSAPCSV